jgi:hypothetical protein
VLTCVESFLDGWHMPDDECQKEADALLAHVKSLIADTDESQAHRDPPADSDETNP